jgi:hypothetical protein
VRSLVVDERVSALFEIGLAQMMDDELIPLLNLYLGILPSRQFHLPLDHVGDTCNLVQMVPSQEYSPGADRLVV